LVSRPKRTRRSNCKLRVLFRATSQVGADGSKLHAPVEQDFAFLWCYKNAAGASGDKLAAAGFVRINPDALHNRSWYEVVPFASLLSREYILAK